MSHSCLKTKKYMFGQRNLVGILSTHISSFKLNKAYFEQLWRVSRLQQSCITLVLFSWGIMILYHLPVFLKPSLPGRSRGHGGFSCMNFEHVYAFVIMMMAVIVASEVVWLCNV